MNVTPAMASALLEERHSNRGIHVTTVQEYLREMKEGRWDSTLPTTQPIVVDHKGQLVNGQHRLTAIALLGRPMMMRFAKLRPGASIEALRLAEVAVRPQKVADLMAALDGKSHTLMRAAFCRMWINIERETRMNVKVPAVLQLRAMRQNAEIFEEVIDSCVSVRTPRLASSPFGGLWLWAATGPHGMRKEFLAFAAPYLRGAGLEQGNPVLTLREYMIGNGFKEVDKIGNMKRIANAFEAHLEGRPMLRVSPSAEGFKALAQRIRKPAAEWVINGRIG